MNCKIVTISNIYVLTLDMNYDRNRRILRIKVASHVHPALRLKASPSEIVGIFRTIIANFIVSG